MCENKSERQAKVVEYESKKKTKTSGRKKEEHEKKDEKKTNEMTNEKKVVCHRSQTKNWNWDRSNR